MGAASRGLIFIGRATAFIAIIFLGRGLAFIAIIFLGRGAGFTLIGLSIIAGFTG